MEETETLRYVYMYILIIFLLRLIPKYVTWDYDNVYIIFHTAMLSPVYATMDKDRFESLPESTNAVEAYNRLSKTGKVPLPLSIVLISLYKNRRTWWQFFNT